jgi:4-amino-4-deoxy-L-arabinose transferase-like glycosyltransferase
LKISGAIVIRRTMLSARIACETVGGRLGSVLAGIPRSERRLLLAAVALGLLVRLGYAQATHDHALAGDQLEYHAQGVFFHDGHPWWSRTPFGIPHPSLWKAPLYPLWVGALYSVGGIHPGLVKAAQVLFGAVVIVLTWLLARRLFGPRAAIAAAFLVAVYPMAFQFEELLYSEAIATPLLLVVLLLAWTRTPTPRRAGLTGVALGVAMLSRPSFGTLGAAILVAWVAAAGWRRGIALTAVAGLVAALVIAPWTIRNHHVDGGFVLISIQDAALYGVFNDEAAHDHEHPWAWRALPRGYRQIVSKPTSDHAFGARLRTLARDYIADHPASVIKAFYWNGIVRTFDVRTPAAAQYEARFEGRIGWFSKLGAWCYVLVALAALAGLWRHRARRGLVLAVAALLLATAIAYTGDGGTRYRAPLEPLLAVLAVAAFVRPRSGAAATLAPVDYGEHISYLVLATGTDVVCSGGTVVGKVAHVLADADEDVFDGVVIDTHLGPGGAHFVDADQVAAIYERALVLTVSSADVEHLPRPTPAPAVMESHGTEDSEGSLQRKLHRAWDLVSGKY